MSQQLRGKDSTAMCEDVHWSYSTQIIWILSTVKFCLSGNHRTGYMPDNWVFQIIRQYLYWLKLLLVTFCYCFYTWAAQLIRGVFNWDISFICWLKVIRAVFCSLHSSGSWWSRR